MNLHENTDFGRKVFFLYPPFDFQKNVITGLFDLEYEVYTINNYKYAKSILRNFPDSICFVCVDSNLSYNEWYNFISSFNDDPILSTIFFGLISSRIPKAMKEKFLMNTMIPAGFVSLNQPTEDLKEVLKNILDINGAKGRRKYIRADCREVPNTAVAISINNQVYNFKIRDISSVGLACIGPVSCASAFKMNMLVRNFSLILSGREYKCNAAVIMTTTTEKAVALVLVFTQGMSYTLKSSIKLFIQDYLQHKIDLMTIEMPTDETDYSKEKKETEKLEELPQEEGLLQAEPQSMEIDGLEPL